MADETLITDITASVMAGDDDTTLDAVIQQFITDWGLTETVAEWRLANYADLRRWAYPPVSEYFDELVAGDMSGEFLLGCGAVNDRFPAFPENPAATAETEPYYITADSTDTFTITNIPNPSTVSLLGEDLPFQLGGVTYPATNIYPVVGVSWEITSGTFIFKVNASCHFTIAIDSDGYNRKTFHVFAQEPA
ncbi:MAG: hypothetical protein ACOY32_15075 [Thermodesulfobacteriota bacterium]